MKHTERLNTRVLRYVLSQPWAVTATTLILMREILSLRAAGWRFTAEEIAERIGVPEARARAGDEPAQAGIAVIPVWGLIGHRANELRDISSRVGTSTEVLGSQIAAAVADPNVAALVLDIDSPGGGVFGVPEVAEQIRSQRGKKPIVAVANALAASAAYWIGASATEMVVTPSGEVGSIGVFTLHVDESEALANEGLKVTPISAGKFKVEANPFEPLSEEAKAYLQSQVDAYYADFTKAVAKGRGVSVDVVRSGFGEGRVVNARDALKLGMVDRVATLDEVLSELTGGARSSSATARVLVQGGLDEDAQAEASRSMVPETIAPVEIGAIVTTPTITGAQTVTIAAQEEDPEPEPVSPPAAEDISDLERRRMRLRILELDGR